MKRVAHRQMKQALLRFCHSSSQKAECLIKVILERSEEREKKLFFHQCSAPRWPSVSQSVKKKTTGECNLNNKENVTVDICQRSVLPPRYYYISFYLSSTNKPLFSCGKHIKDPSDVCCLFLLHYG